MDTLIIGNGEIGKALFNILSKAYKSRIIDREPEDSPLVEIMHICFPYSDKFRSEVKRYQNIYNPKITVIHSTVPVGTSKSLKTCHSPVMGIHPYLEESLRTFVKFVGGRDADEVAGYFKQAGLKVQICRKSETTELAKLMDTLYYGVSIEFAKEAESLCIEYKVPFAEAYTLWNRAYNEGYEGLGRKEVIRPILQPIQRKIGGHCVIPNLDMIKSKFSLFIKKLQ